MFFLKPEWRAIVAVVSCIDFVKERVMRVKRARANQVVANLGSKISKMELSKMLQLEVNRSQCLFYMKEFHFQAQARLNWKVN